MLFISFDLKNAELSASTMLHFVLVDDAVVLAYSQNLKLMTVRK
jgi:hypothetical protein